MPVAKHLSYARSRSRTERSRRIDGLSFVHPRALPQQVSSPRSAIAAVSVTSRSIFKATTQFAESVGDILLTIASWMLREILAGFLAYAMAMYGIPEAAVRAESGKPKPSAPPAPPRKWSRPTVHVFSVDTEANIRAGEIVSPPDAAQPCASVKFAARSEQTLGARLGWRTVIIPPAVLLLTKIREGYERRRAIAELPNLDDRSLKDIGISRTDSGSIARHGVRPE